MQDGARWDPSWDDRADEHHPELEEWEPHESGAGSRRRLVLMRAFVIVAITALVLPGALSTWALADSTAQHACAIATEAMVGTAHSSTAHFQVFGPGVVSWECYSITATGEDWIISLGAIPGLPTSLDRQQALAH